ncbi:MAG: glycosyltransferase family 2 protein [Lachnospiraceae bacterium]|nr:glycosyltransferase family 2 protein [Lachnospiraceae bacterium]
MACLDQSKLLSVIVPMYNVERYIEQCLESLSCSDWIGDLEVLIINDGSSDCSSRLAEKFESQYPQIFRIIDKENGGHGSAINRGIEEAVGKYFKVVDGDDWVDKKKFAQLLSYLKEIDTDLVITGYYWVDEHTGKKTIERRYNFFAVDYGRTYQFDTLPKEFALKMHAVTFRTSILKQMPARMDEHCFYVDVEYILFPLPYIKTVIFYDMFVYQYRVGMRTQSVSAEKMRSQCGQHGHVLCRLLRFYENCLPELSQYKADFLAGSIARMAVSQYKIFLSFPASSVYYQKIRTLEKHLQQKYRPIYRHIRHPAILLLRMTNYFFYPVVSYAVRRRFK